MTDWQEYLVYREGYRRGFEDAEKKWIPCKEKLPSKQCDYLVTIRLDNNSTYVDVMHFHKGKFYGIDSEWGDVVCDDVTAWMPLPEPWKGDNDE